MAQGIAGLILWAIILWPLWGKWCRADRQRSARPATPTPPTKQDSITSSTKWDTSIPESECDI